MSTELRQRTDGSAGFTLIEVLVSMLLLTVMMTGLAALQLGVVAQNRQSDRSSQARMLAQRVIETYQAQAFDQLPAVQTPPSWQSVPNRDGAPMQNIAADGVNGGPFTVSCLAETPTTGGRLVSVQVTWLSSSAGKYQVENVILTLQRFQ